MWGFCLWWSDLVDLHVVFVGQYFVLVKLTSAHLSNGKSSICFVYIPPYNNLKLNTWHELQDHIDQSQIPWRTIGDLNDIIFF